MAVEYRGVSNVAKRIKHKYRGVSNVSRAVKKRYRGISNVARLCFTDGLTLYKEGTNYWGVSGGTVGAISFDSDAITFSNVKDTSYFIAANSVDYSKYKYVNVRMVITAAQTNAKYYGLMLKYCNSYMKSTEDKITLNMPFTVTYDISTFKNLEDQLFMLYLYGTDEEFGDSRYALGGKIYEIWCE